MEIFEMILGLTAFYAWAHTVVLMFKYMKKMTVYETTVAIYAVVVFVLYVMGTING